MTPQDFEQAFSKDATQEQIDAVNRACAEAEGRAFLVLLGRFGDLNYVQSPDNSERLIRKAIDAGLVTVRCGYTSYDENLYLAMDMKPSSKDHWATTKYWEKDEVNDLVCAPQWARLYAAWKVLKGQGQ